MKEWVGGRLVWVEPTASSVVARLNLANGIWDLNEINDYIYDGLWPNALSVQPLYVANGYLSVLRTDDINEAEFSNAVVANGYLSVLRTDDINEAEFSNAVVANGYLSVLRTDDIFSLPSQPTNVINHFGNINSGATVYNPTNDICSVGAVEWSPPVSDGGSPITGYKISGNLGSLVVGPQYRIVNLGPNWGAGAIHLASYGSTVSVIAINREGEGPANTQISYHVWYDCG